MIKYIQGKTMRLFSLLFLLASCSREAGTMITSYKYRCLKEKTHMVWAFSYTGSYRATNVTTCDVSRCMAVTTRLGENLFKDVEVSSTLANEQLCVGSNI